MPIFPWGIFMFKNNCTMIDSFFSKRRNMVVNAVLYTFLWGCAFPLVKICMESFQIAETDHLSKCLLAGIRFTFSGVLTLLCRNMFSGKCCLTRKTGIYILLYGITATTFQYSFTYIALSGMNGSKGAVYDQLGVFVIVLISGLFFRNDGLNSHKLLGCILGFLGVLLINNDNSGFSFRFEGEGIMLLAVLCQTFAFVIAKFSANAVEAPILTGFGQFLGGGLLCVVSLLGGGRIRTINLTSVLTLVLLIVISAAAYTLSLIPLRYYPVSEVSSFNLLITFFGVIMSAVLLKENIFQLHYAGSMVLISCGILLINRRKTFAQGRPKEENRL